MTLKTLIASAALLLTSICVNAQVGMLEYAVGARLGTGTGISGQYFYTDHHVFEGIVFTRWKGFSVTGLYEHHMQIQDVKGLKWYMGVGGHTSFYPIASTHPDLGKSVAGNAYFFGGDAILGLEYFFRSIPIQMSVDIKPEYNFGIIDRLDMTNGGISLRYRF